MGKIEINKLLAALIFAFCLLFISNYVGNTIIPPFKYYDLAKSKHHDWIKWPETQNKKDVKFDENKKNAKKRTLETEQSLGVLLKTADIGKGKKLARKCVACHSFEKGGKNKIGPNLFAIMGRERGATPSYNYSKALREIGGKWGFIDMDRFLFKPKKFLPGTKMSFKGIKSLNDRAALIMYLRSFAQIPLNLPE